MLEVKRCVIRGKENKIIIIIQKDWLIIGGQSRTVLRVAKCYYKSPRFQKARGPGASLFLRTVEHRFWKFCPATDCGPSFFFQRGHDTCPNRRKIKHYWCLTSEHPFLPDTSSPRSVIRDRIPTDRTTTTSAKYGPTTTTPRGWRRTICSQPKSAVSCRTVFFPLYSPSKRYFFIILPNP